ncbi:MAG: pyridoxal phosphate-dependent aminotransferase, partial [Candidatus Acidiferrales bacterium]
MKRIAPSATLLVLMEKEKLVARGIDVVDFGPGEPDFPTPEHIKRAAVKALDENKTKYTASGGIM